MTLRIPRLLPLTIVVMGLLLSLKCATLVIAAAPAIGEATAGPAAHAAPPPVPPALSFAPARASIAAPVDNGEQQILLDLRKRHQDLEAREKALRARESILAAAEQKLGQRVAELQALQARLEALETQRSARENANWQGLVTLYEKMKPREAAKIFDDLDMPVLLQLVDRMAEPKAAGILAAMNPQRARDVTAELAALRQRRTTIDPAKHD